MRLALITLAATKMHEIAQEKEWGRWRGGEVVDVFDADKQNMTGADGEPSFNRIYITDWKGTLEEAKEILLKLHADQGGNPLARRKAVVPDSLFGGQRHVSMTVAEVAQQIRQRKADQRDQLETFRDNKLDEIARR